VPLDVKNAASTAGHAHAIAPSLVVATSLTVAASFALPSLSHESHDDEQAMNVGTKARLDPITAQKNTTVRTRTRTI
jgi:hypothetical protein